MSEPKIEIMGAYKLEFSDEDIQQFIEDSFGDALDDAEKHDLLTAKRQELASVVAFDVHVTSADESFSVADFTQPGSDQTAYYEVYLTSDGRSIESDIRPKDAANFRIYFFLHFVDNRKPLVSSYGELTIPALKPLPSYLNEIHPFAPVD